MTSAKIEKSRSETNEILSQISEIREICGAGYSVDMKFNIDASLGYVGVEIYIEHAYNRWGLPRDGYDDSVTIIRKSVAEALKAALAKAKNIRRRDFDDALTLTARRILSDAALHGQTIEECAASQISAEDYRLKVVTRAMGLIPKIFARPPYPVEARAAH